LKKPLVIASRQGVENKNKQENAAKKQAHEKHRVAADQRKFTIPANQAGKNLLGERGEAF
jgi:hypothetical protein